MSESSDHVTRQELNAELRSLKNEMRLLMVGVVVVLSPEVPKELTVAALVAIVGKSVWGLLFRA